MVFSLHPTNSNANAKIVKQSKIFFINVVFNGEGFCALPFYTRNFMEKKLEIGEVSKPRYEFRSFGQCFCAANRRMARLSEPVPEKVWERTSDEIYIVSRANDVNNTKIRDGKMDIKTLVAEKNGLEQWEPLMKGEFPMHCEMLEKEAPRIHYWVYTRFACSTGRAACFSSPGG